MGRGTYSSFDRNTRAQSSGYFTKSAEEIFEQRHVHPSMSPMNLGTRESRDSEEHPESLAIMLGLDETGSMFTVPHYLIKVGLPHIISSLMEKGILHPQLLFMGIGDHKCDQGPAQVGQFESSDELIDQELTNVWLEGRGGGNGGESYLLAWYVAAFHTSIDCFEKRGEKGICITVGDEPCHPSLSAYDIQRIFGRNPENSMTAEELIHRASLKYHLHHIIVGGTSHGDDSYVHNGWKALLGECVHYAKNQADVPDIIAQIVLDNAKPKTTSVKKDEPKKESAPSSSGGGIML